MKEFQKLQELDILLQSLRRNGIYKRVKTKVNDAAIMILFHISFRSQYQYVRATDIAESLGVTIPAITHKVKDLIKQGYLDRTVSKEDARVFHLLLTKKGINYVDSIKDTYYGSLKKVVSHMSEKEISVLMRLLTKIDKFGKIS